MTTENLDQEGIDNLRAATRYSAENARERAEKLVGEIDGLEAQRAQDQRDAELAKRLLDRQNVDLLRPKAEEARQLAEVIGTPASAAPEGATPGAGELEGTVLPPPEPPTATAPAVEVPADRPRDEMFNWTDTPLRPQTSLAWLLALLGALLGFVFGVLTHDFGGNLPGVIDGLVSVMWVIGLIVFGFGLGALIGNFLNRGNTAEGNED